MTARYTEAEVTCDALAKGTGWCTRYIKGYSLADARRRAAGAGWTRQRADGDVLYDVCPEHSKRSEATA